MKEKLMLRGIRLYLQSMGRLAPRHASKVAARLFTRPRKRPAVKPEYQKRVAQATAINVEVKGFTLRGYDWGGDGPVALLLHGWESRAARMSVLLPVLQQHGYRAIAFDAPAHGDSTGEFLHVPLYASVLTELLQRYQPQAVVGHSMGALASLYTFAHLGPFDSVKYYMGIGIADDPEKIIHDAANLLGLPTPALNHFIVGFQALTKDIALPELNKAQLLRLCPPSLKVAFVHAHDDKIASISSVLPLSGVREGVEVVVADGQGHNKIVGCPQTLQALDRLLSA